MKTRFEPLLVALTLLVIAAAAQAATITWTNTSGGNWSATNNWSPHRLPATNDVVLITTPGTYTVTLDFTPNYTVFYPDVTLGAGGGAAGVQTLAMTNVGFYFTNLLVTTGGVITAVSATIGSVDGEKLTVNGGVLNSVSGFVCGGGSSLLVTNGGAVTCTGGYVDHVTVASGGVLQANGGTLGLATIANGGRCIANGLSTGNYETLTVAHGGVLDITNGLFVFGPLINSGTINLTNSYIYIYVMAFAYNGGLYNQPGGVINVAGGTRIGQDTGDFINQGALIESAGPGCTVNVGNFDNTQGTVTNLAGTLVLGTYQTNLAGTYFAAAGATNQLVGANNAAPLTPGIPLVLGGSGQYQLTSGYLRLLTNTIPKLVLVGTTLELGPVFQGGAITNLALNGITLSNSLPVTGMFAAANSAIQGNFTVASGAVFTESNSATYGSVTVASGGLMIANAGVFVAGPLTVAHGGVFNIAGALSLFGPLTNAGIINLTNAPVLISGGGILNQADGLMDFWGNGANIAANYASDFLINRGRVTQSAGAATNRINVLGFDTRQGTVTNLAGTLVLGTFYTNLAGTFSAAPGATIQLSGGTAGTPVTPGTPLVMAGGGQYQFTSGYLSLPATVPTGMLLLGGTLQLGPSFQGGAITNLMIGGITLTNTLPVTGRFTATNSPLYGHFTVASGGTMYANRGTLHGAVTVANGGLFSVFNPLEGTTVWVDGSLTVASGGTLNLAGILQLFSPLTNAGTINLTNAPILMANDGRPSSQGGLLNQPAGVINFWADDAGISGGSGHEYLVNQGHITKHAGSSTNWLDVMFTTNSGVVTAESGAIGMGYYGPASLQPGSSLNVVLNNATNYGKIRFDGPAPLGGAFNVTLANGYVPAQGVSFTVVSYDSYSGNFASLGLPPAVNWQSAYTSTNLVLTVVGARLQFESVTRSGTNLIFSGAGGTPGSPYRIVASTNVALPLIIWTAVATNTFDATGHFSYTNRVSPNKPHQFFTLKTP